MKKFGQILSLCIAGVALLFSKPVMAEECCEWSGCFRAGAELLYWRPTNCGWRYGATIFNQDPGLGEDLVYDQKVLTMTPAFGFRLFGAYDSADGCDFLELSWTYLKATDAAKVRNDNGADALVIAQLVNAGPQFKAEASQKFEYTRVWLRGGHYLYQGCACNFYTFAGMEFLDLNQKRNVQGFSGQTTPVLSEYHEKSEYYAVALDLGFGGEFHIGCGINIAGRIAGMVAVGRRKHRFFTNIANAESQAYYPSRIHYVPGLESRLGFNYARECGCMEFTVELGYQLDYWFRPLTTARGPSEAGDFFFSGCDDLGLGGPYCSFQVRF